MPQTVVINCPQGIQRLIDLGRAVAASQNWNHPQAKEAVVGLWLDAQLTRAELRDTLEVIDNRVQAATDNQVTATDAKSLDDVLGQWLRLLDLAATQGGATPIDNTTLNIQLPRETGVVPVAVTVAAIAGVAIVGSVGLWQAGQTARAVLAQIGEWRATAAGVARATVIAGRMKVERRTDMTEVERFEMATERNRSITAANNLTKPTATSLFGDIDTELMIGAGLAALLIWALARNRSPA